MALVARGVARAVTVVVIAGAPLTLAAPAMADLPPGCSAGDFEQISAEVSAATSAYLFTHPDVNAFYSGLRGQSKEQTRRQISDYLAANPQTQADMGAIRQPLHDMKMRCQ